MSFRFSQDAFKDDSFNQKVKEKLTKALNSYSSRNSPSMYPSGQRNSTSENAGVGLSNKSERSSTTIISSERTKSALKNSKMDILRSEIIVQKVDFASIPQFEILDLDISAQPRSLAKGICKIACKDAMVQIQTEIEANLLLVSMENSPEFTNPHMICNNSFMIPISMTFSQIQLEAITNIFVKNSGIGISFNDVILDFHFDCSIKLLQSHIAKRLKDSMQMIFKDVLPSVIFSMSQCWFTHSDSSVQTGTHTTNEQSSVPATALYHKIVFTEADLQDLSPANMLKLSTLISSRQTLSLHSNSSNIAPIIAGSLERQSLYRFNRKIPSLTNFYKAEVPHPAQELKRNNSGSPAPLAGHAYVQNLLPSTVVENETYKLEDILSIQTKIYERTTRDASMKPKRRKIKMKKHKKESIIQEEVQPKSEVLDVASSSSFEEEKPQSELVSSQLTKKQKKDLEKETTQISLNSSQKLVDSPSTLPLRLPLSISLPRFHLGTLNKLMQKDISLRSTSTSATNNSSNNSFFTPNIVMSKQAMPSFRPFLNSNSSILEESGYFTQHYFEKRPYLYSTASVPQQESDISLHRPGILDSNRRLSFVGLDPVNHEYQWGNEDQPPPYF